MTDGVSISNSQTGASRSVRSHYQTEAVHEVRSRAQFLEHAQSPQEQAGVKRLDRLLQQGQPLDPGAPRGFYLNIRV